MKTIIGIMKMRAEYVQHSSFLCMISKITWSVACDALFEGVVIGHVHSLQCEQLCFFDIQSFFQRFVNEYQPQKVNCNVGVNLRWKVVQSS